MPDGTVDFLGYQLSRWYGPGWILVEFPQVLLKSAECFSDVSVAACSAHHGLVLRDRDGFRILRSRMWMSKMHHCCRCCRLLSVPVGPMPPIPPLPSLRRTPAIAKAAPLQVKVKLGGPVHRRGSDPSDPSNSVSYAGFRETPIADVLGTVFRSDNGGLVQLTSQDVFVDLGCGHGEVLLAAHAAYPECRIIGVELDAATYKRAQEATVDTNIQVLHADLDSCFTLPWKALCEYEEMKTAASETGKAPLDPELPLMSQATVVYLFLGEWANLTLRPRLMQSLPIGARIISRSFSMGHEWPADAVLRGGHEVIYRLYQVTERVKCKALLASTELEDRFGLHWLQPPPGNYRPAKDPAEKKAPFGDRCALSSIFCGVNEDEIDLGSIDLGGLGKPCTRVLVDCGAQTDTSLQKMEHLRD
eukprot:s645_g31.t1